jgi:hypothetical protein
MDLVRSHKALCRRVITLSFHILFPFKLTYMQRNMNCLFDHSNFSFGPVQTQLLPFTMS